MADFRLIRPRCNAPAALLLLPGSVSPRRRTSVCSAVVKRERCCELPKRCLQLRISNALSALRTTFVAIFERFDWIVWKRVFLLHAKLSRILARLRVCFSSSQARSHERQQNVCATEPRARREKAIMRCFHASRLNEIRRPIGLP